MKNDISTYPFELFAPNSGGGIIGPEALEALASARFLSSYSGWMLPQLNALFGSFRINRNEEGKIDPLRLLKDNIGHDPYLTGVWNVCTRLKRSSLVAAQNTSVNARYSALVPLIMAGIKDHQGIQYSEYSLVGLEHLMGMPLFEAATSTPEILSLDRVLELRLAGLTNKTGAKAGLVKNPVSVWTLTGLKGTEWQGIPKLAATMMAQIWVAHPSLRSPYMILDPYDWDHMPEPLVDAEPLVGGGASSTSNKKVALEIPW